MTTRQSSERATRSWPRWCKPVSTVAAATLCCAALWACGGSQKPSRDHYGATVDKQRACCTELSDPNERAACIDRIITIDDEGVAKSPENQATFRCMNEHFTCDPTTGEATQESKQAQLDCINDL